jgi:hypothetical protein
MLKSALPIGSLFLVWGRVSRTLTVQPASISSLTFASVPDMALIEWHYHRPRCFSTRTDTGIFQHVNGKATYHEDIIPKDNTIVIGH